MPPNTVSKVKRKKTFTGCWTCRSRKVKCDTTKPFCIRCQKSGMECLGYDIKLRWSPPIRYENGIPLTEPKSIGSNSYNNFSNNSNANNKGGSSGNGSSAGSNTNSGSNTNNNTSTNNLDDNDNSYFQRRNIAFVKYPKHMSYETYDEMDKHLSILHSANDLHGFDTKMLGPFAVFDGDWKKGGKGGKTSTISARNTTNNNNNSNNNNTGSGSSRTTKHNRSNSMNVVAQSNVVDVEDSSKRRKLSDSNIAAGNSSSSSTLPQQQTHLSHFNNPYQQQQQQYLSSQTPSHVYGPTVNTTGTPTSHNTHNTNDFVTMHQLFEPFHPTGTSEHPLTLFNQQQQHTQHTQQQQNRPYSATFAPVVGANQNIHGLVSQSQIPQQRHLRNEIHDRQQSQSQQQVQQPEQLYYANNFSSHIINNNSSNSNSQNNNTNTNNNDFQNMFSPANSYNFTSANANISSFKKSIQSSPQIPIPVLPNQSIDPTIVNHTESQQDQQDQQQQDQQQQDQQQQQQAAISNKTKTVTKSKVAPTASASSSLTQSVHIEDGDEKKDSQFLTLIEVSDASIDFIPSGVRPASKVTVFALPMTRFLLTNYHDNVADLMTVIFLPNNPWKTMHFSRAIKALGEYCSIGNSSCINMCTFNSILSISAFKLRNAFPRNSDGYKYWTRFAEDAKNVASTLMNDSIQANLYDQKYKDVLVAILSMSTVDVSSGTMRSCKDYLDLCEEFIANRMKKNKRLSAKAKTLHRIFSFTKKIQESTQVFDVPEDTDVLLDEGPQGQGQTQAETVPSMVSFNDAMITDFDLDGNTGNTGNTNDENNSIGSNNSNFGGGFDIGNEFGNGQSGGGNSSVNNDHGQGHSRKGKSKIDFNDKRNKIQRKFLNNHKLKSAAINASQGLQAIEEKEEKYSHLSGNGELSLRSELPSNAGNVGYYNSNFVDIQTDVADLEERRGGQQEGEPDYNEIGDYQNGNNPNDSSNNISNNKNSHNSNNQDSHSGSGQHRDHDHATSFREKINEKGKISIEYIVNSNHGSPKMAPQSPKFIDISNLEIAKSPKYNARLNENQSRDASTHNQNNHNNNNNNNNNYNYNNTNHRNNFSSDSNDSGFIKKMKTNNIATKLQEERSKTSKTSKNQDILFSTDELFGLPNSILLLFSQAVDLFQRKISLIDKIVQDSQRRQANDIKNGNNNNNMDRNGNGGGGGRHEVSNVTKILSRQFYSDMNEFEKRLNSWDLEWNLWDGPNDNKKKNQDGKNQNNNSNKNNDDDNDNDDGSDNNNNNINSHGKNNRRRPFSSALHEGVYYHLMSFYNGIKIYFYRIIKHVPRVQVEPYIKDCISHLMAMQRIIDSKRAVLSPIFWQGFIAGCETDDLTLRVQFSKWCERMSETGVNNYHAAHSLMKKVWEMREKSEDESITWIHVLRDYDISLMLT